MKLRHARASVIPLDGSDALIGLRRAAGQMFAILAMIDGQNSETVIDRITAHEGIGQRQRVTTASPFYMQAPQAPDAPFGFVEGQTLKCWGATASIAVPIRDYDVNACTVTPDGRIAFINAPNQLLRIDLEQRTIQSQPSDEQWFGMAVSPDGRHLAVTTNHTGREVTLLDVETFEVAQTFDVGTFVYQPAFSPDGRWLVVGDARGVQLLERESGTVRRIRDAGFEIMSCVFDPTGCFVASAERELVITERETGQERGRWSLDALRAEADLSAEQLQRAREADDAPWALRDETDAGAGVSSVAWDDAGLWAAALGGHVWGLVPEE